MFTLNVGLFFLSIPIPGFVPSDRFAWNGPLRLSFTDRRNSSQPVSYTHLVVYKRQHISDGYDRGYEENVADEYRNLLPAVFHVQIPNVDVVGYKLS